MHEADAGNVCVPEGWEARRVGDFCDILSGGTPRKSEAHFWTGDIPWVSGKDLKSLELSDSIDHVTADAVVDGSRLAPEGSVLLLVRGMGLAKDLPVATITRPMAFNQDVKALVPRDGLSGSFLCFAIYHAKKRLLSRIVPSAHGTMTLNLDDVQNLNLAIPVQKDEADVIAQVLRATRRAITIETSAAADTAKLKSVAMRELFSRGLRGEEQKETEIGVVPSSWHLMRVRDIVSVKGGKRMPKGVSLVSENTGQPYIRVTDFYAHSVRDEGVLFVPSEFQKLIERYRISSAEIYISIAGTIGVVGQVPQKYENANLTENAAKLSSFRSNTHPRFLMYALASDACQYQIAQATAKNAQPKLALTRIEQLLVPIPSTLNEQREISDILDTIDRKIALHKRKRAVLESLFKSLLHKLMTGEIRVSDLNLAALDAQATAGTEA